MLASRAADARPSKSAFSRRFFSMISRLCEVEGVRVRLSRIEARTHGRDGVMVGYDGAEEGDFAVSKVRLGRESVPPPLAVMSSKSVADLRMVRGNTLSKKLGCEESGARKDVPKTPVSREPPGQTQPVRLPCRRRGESRARARPKQAYKGDKIVGRKAGGSRKKKCRASWRQFHLHVPSRK